MNHLDFCHCCGALRGVAASQARFFLSDLVEIQGQRPMQRGDGRLYEQSPQLSVHISVQRNGGGLADREHVCNDCLLVGVRHALKTLSALTATQHKAPSPWDPQHTTAHGRTVPPPPFPPAPPRSNPPETTDSRTAAKLEMADEYQRWIDHFHKGGDYDSFLRIELSTSKGGA